MTSNYWNTCTIVCWGLAVLIGAVVFSIALEPTSVIAALLLAIAFASFLGLILNKVVCGSMVVSQDETKVGAHGRMVSAKPEPDAPVAGSDGRVHTTSPDIIAGMADNAPKPNPPQADGPKGTPPEGDRLTPNRQDPTPLAGDKAEASAAPAEADETAKTDAAEKAAANAEQAAAIESTPDYDKDGVKEGTNEGTRPEALSAARDGKADNLKEIKGIGPKLETLCNSLGFYHFDQIANWSADEVAWVDANLQGFKGRVSRDEWVKQAKILASGGETEFSKRVEDGDVY